MKHYAALNQLETEIYHLGQNFALFDSVMEAHMNEFDKSQTPLGLSLWRLVELMRTNTEEIKDQFYDLFDAIREESHKEESETSQADKLITPWNHTVNDLQKVSTSKQVATISSIPHDWNELDMSNFIVIDPTGGDSVPVESMQLDLFDSQDYITIK